MRKQFSKTCILFQRLFLFRLHIVQSHRLSIAILYATVSYNCVTVVAVAMGMAIPVRVAVAVGPQVV